MNSLNELELINVSRTAQYKKISESASRTSKSDNCSQNSRNSQINNKSKELKNKTLIQQQKNKSSHLKPHASGTFSFICTTLILILIFIIFLPEKVHASEEGMQKNKYYDVYTVESGDTLWKIASIYSGNEYDSYNDYINEVKTINNIYNDYIATGSKIIIPYYN